MRKRRKKRKEINRLEFILIRKRDGQSTMLTGSVAPKTTTRRWSGLDPTAQKEMTILSKGPKCPAVFPASSPMPNGKTVGV